ncbi:MAG: transposase-like protein [Desulforhopalus sp.]|jgi:transposase-like protein
MAKRHANATTTPEVRAFISQSDLPTAFLARLLKISESTVRKWRKRDSVNDESHRPKHLKTTLTGVQEHVVVELRTCLMLPLDDLLGVCKEFVNPKLSRAGLQRLLKRNGISRLTTMPVFDEKQYQSPLVQVEIEENQSQEILSFEISPDAMLSVLNRNVDGTRKEASPLENVNNKEDLNEREIVQVKVTTLPDEKHRLLLANDPDSSWVYIDLYDDDDIAAATRYMNHVLTKAPFHIRRLLAANYNEFLSRFRLLTETNEQQSDDENAPESKPE